MYEIYELPRDEFLDVVRSVEYRDDDIREAREFMCDSILQCYEIAKHRFAKYYVIYEGVVPVVTVMLQRDGQIIFFISKYVGNHVGIVRLLRRFARYTADRCGPITTITANWYKEALRINKLVGFVPFRLGDTSQIWVFGYKPFEDPKWVEKKKRIEI